MKYLALVLLAACGDPADDAGTGTDTLVVTGSASATSSVANSADPTTFTTDFTLQITRAGAPVSDGSVTVGGVALVFDTTAMRWHGAQAGYAATYALDIASGSDAVSGVQLTGPDIQTFTAPTAGATVDSTQPIAVAWDREAEATIATLSTRDVNDLAIPDSGSYQLAAGTLRSKKDQVENERLQLMRARQLTPAGAAAGSSVRVAVSTEIELLVQPTQVP